MEKLPRKKRLLHAPIQGALVLRVAVQWVAMLACIASTSFILQVILDPLADEAARLHNLKVTMISFGLVTIALLPPFLWDLVKFSHRFVGPIVRLREWVKRTSLEGPTTTLAFRKGDHWQELATEVNEMMMRLRTERVLDHACDHQEEKELEPVGSSH